MYGKYRRLKSELFQMDGKFKSTKCPHPSPWYKKWGDHQYLFHSLLHYQKIISTGALLFTFEFMLSAQYPHNSDYYLRSEEHTSELQSRGHLVCRPLLVKKKTEEENTHENILQ